MAQLLSNLPIGAKIKFGKHQINNETAWPIVWIIADKNHSGYPSNSVTLMSEKVIDLRAYDARESSWTNKLDTSNGYHSYAVSNIHQWLNSEASAGNWYTAQHAYDTPPTSSGTVYGTPYQARPGFLYNFTVDERLSLLPTTLSLQVGEVLSSIVAKVFLPSFWETTGTHVFTDGSTKLSYFTSASAGTPVCEQVITNSTSSNKPSSTSLNWGYWTRNTWGQNAGNVTSNGGNGNVAPSSGDVGIRPCVNLLLSTKVTSTLDSDGCYSVLAQNAPVISGTNSNLGTKSAGFSQTYSVTDADNEAVTVTEYIDNVKVRSYVATLGATNTLAVTGATWLKLANGAHTLKIIATDGFDEATRTYTFTKSVPKLVVQRSTPIESSTQPKSIIVTVVKNIPEGAIFKVEACNNGFDTAPTWEDITTRVLQGRIYDFVNIAKTAGKWGINIRVTVDRNGAEGACYITEIGGNFE